MTSRGFYKKVFPALVIVLFVFSLAFISKALAQGTGEEGEESIGIIKFEIFDSDRDKGDSANLWTITPLPLTFEPDKSSGSVEISLTTEEGVVTPIKWTWNEKDFKKTEEEATFAPYRAGAGTKLAYFTVGLTDKGEKAWYFSLAESFTSFPALAGLADGLYTFDVKVAVDGKTLKGSVIVKKEGKIWKMADSPKSPPPPTPPQKEKKSFLER